MLEKAEHRHQFTAAAIAAAIGRAKRLTHLHCMHSSRFESVGLKTARQKKEGAGGEMNSWLSRFLQAFLLKFGCCLQLHEFMLSFCGGKHCTDMPRANNPTQFLW